MGYTWYMNCKDMELYIADWEKGKTSPESSPDSIAFRDHLEDCPSCKARLGALATLVEREWHTFPPEECRRFADSVMEKIAIEKTYRKRKSLSLRSRYSPILALALSLLVFGAGFVYRGMFAPDSSDMIDVHFSFIAPEASSVVLVGSFPDWAVSGQHEMKKTVSGQWVLDVQLKKSGIYTYSFLVNGNTWIPDPEATEVIEDGFGGINSLLRL